MKKFFLILIILFAVFVPKVFADVATNTGFIPGQIWYSKEPLVEGDTVNIYTAVWNSDANPLSVKVEFYDKNVILGSRDITISQNQLKDVSIPWKITSGDHAISAKITSSSISASGKTENITLDNSTTAEDKQFVPATIKTSNGAPASASDIIQNGIEQVSSKINDVLPTSISEPISNSLGVVDNFRDSNYVKVNNAKIATQKELNSSVSSQTISKPLDATQKPITYIKLFLLTALAFILGNKIVFYGLLVVIIFLITRSIYRKISNR
ncbi:MAG TPA: hypothetical protein VMR49_03505 [Candidatus Paceibacterota bacterium]|jgi:hypothetical protein|nr:hypothetical protein [Candidatus Paceibacterota bacterium]